MTYVIGIDGGGTKTKAVLCDQHGQVYASISTGPSNPNTVNQIELNQTINMVFKELMEEAPQQFNECHVCFAGMSGIGEEKNYNLLDGIFTDVCNKYKMDFYMNNDAINALYAGTLGEDGIVHISGTGSITLSLHNGEMNRVGGWGYLFDDLGSGYAIGKDCLAAVFHDYDGRAMQTGLTKKVLKLFNCKEVSELIKVIYNSVNARLTIAKVSRVAFECIDEGDFVATQIIRNASREIAHSINTLIEKNDNNLTTQVVLSGGIFNRDDIMIPFVKEYLARPVALKTVQIEPVYGAVVAAFRTIGVRCDENFECTIKAYEEGNNE
ncbi:N-acetylglucosamine kinase [Piscibacillus sp. B03]|uniref:N-acetylglucosamine kinase n=1 Tax=Piscibacillus sp. B03 TaxID=3457430 RepID=UPI003FCE53D5